MEEHLAGLLTEFREEERKINYLRRELRQEVDDFRERRESIPDELWERQKDLWKAEGTLKEMWEEVRKAEGTLHTSFNKEGISPEEASRRLRLAHIG